MINKLYNLKNLINTLNENGGDAYFVGGFVRDLLFNKPSKDIDIEIFNITPDELIDICRDLSIDLDYVGKSFGVYKCKLDGYDIDLSFPRKERLIGDNHKSFDVEVNPFLSLKDAAKRRDFTINSIMMNVLTNEIVDEFNGIDDLNKGIIRHVSSAFSEDPLRVLRAAQFAARFNFEVAEETKTLCRALSLNNVSEERISEELNKALLKSDKPSKFFRILKDIKNETFSLFDEVFISNEFDKKMLYLDKLAKLQKSNENYISMALSILMPETVEKLTRERKTLRFTNTFKLDNIKEILLYKLDNISMKSLALYKAFKLGPNALTLLTTIGALKLNDIINLNTDLLFYQTNLISSKDLLSAGLKPGKDFAKKLELAQIQSFKGLDKQEIIRGIL